MTLYNYIRRRSYDDVTFTEFDRNSNFISDDVLPTIVACSRSHENCSFYLMNFIRDGTKLQII